MLLETILIVTVGTADLGLTEKAYSDSLAYSTVERGAVPAALAETWGAPKMAGRSFVLMQPSSKENIYLRFVEVTKPASYAPMKTFGWNAIEILVQDPDELERKFIADKSLFEVIGRPRPLGPNSPIRAMQVVGPASEVLYLTRIPPDPKQERHTAQTPVDRPFIIILGGPQIEDLRRFYADAFGLPVSEPTKARMTVLNKTHGLDIETTHPLAIARISPKYSLELDGYPATAVPRPVVDGELPYAVAMLSFEVASLDAVSQPLLAPPRAVEGAPYQGRRVGVVRGAAGELLELIERR